MLICQKLATYLKTDIVKYIGTSYSLIFLIVLFVACGAAHQEDTPTNTISTPVLHSDSLQQVMVQTEKTFNEEDILLSEKLADSLQSIRANFKRINSISQWTSISTEELPESAEGGTARYFYHNKQLEKIVAQQYGECYQVLSEYYLLNGQLSFAFERRYQYNRPIYYDATAMKANNDTEAFDLDKSSITELRSYFENGKLLHQVNHANVVPPNSGNDLVQEQERLREEFETLMELRKK